MKQTTFAGLAYSQKKKQTRREKFLAEMDQVIPWDDICALIEPPKPTKTRGGRVSACGSRPGKKIRTGGA